MEVRKLQQIELELSVIYEQYGGVMTNQVDNEALIRLEGRRITLPLERE